MWDKRKGERSKKTPKIMRGVGSRGYEIQKGRKRGNRALGKNSKDYELKPVAHEREKLNACAGHAIN